MPGCPASREWLPLSLHVLDMFPAFQLPSNARRWANLGWRLCSALAQMSLHP